jgi:hypothetical protein
MQNGGIKLLLLSSAMVLASSAQASVITTLYNTGVDLFGVPQVNGAVETHYSLLSVPGGTTNVRVATTANGFPLPPWLGDNSLSAWIGPAGSSDLDGPVGIYTYRTTFDLTGFIPGTAVINGQWSMDNLGVDILINGVSISPSSTDFLSWTGFTISSNFVAGINTLDFVINNQGGPTGLRVEMTGDATAATTGVPEPASFILFGAGIGAIGLIRRRRTA